MAQGFCLAFWLYFVVGHQPQGDRRDDFLLLVVGPVDTATVASACGAEGLDGDSMHTPLLKGSDVPSKQQHFLHEHD